MIVALVASHEIESHRRIAEHFATVEQIEATRHVRAALLFDDEEQLDAWLSSADFSRRFGGCTVEVHDLEDMRKSKESAPRCRECAAFPLGAIEQFGLCPYASDAPRVIGRGSLACYEFEKKGE